jgi:putative acetyltransferase
MSIPVRKELPKDIEAIELLTEKAFLNAPHTDHTEQYIVASLRKADALSISMVVEDAGMLIGHVAVSSVTISDGSDGWFGLGPISVIPDRQGQGVGSQLMEEALGTLKKSGAKGCVLLGDPKYYHRFGFNPHPNLVFPDVPPEYFQVISFCGNFPVGTVTYHEAFIAKS